MKLVGTALVVALVLLYLAAAFSAPLNVDAGYYISLSRQVAEGRRPVADFPTSYPPGAYYALSRLGSRALHWPTAVKAAVYALHLVNLALLAWLLVRRNVPLHRAVFWAGLWGWWVLAAEGKAIALEGLVNAALLVGLLLAGARGGWTTSIGGGLAAGCALFTKQYALLFVPLFAATAWRGGWHAARLTDADEVDDPAGEGDAVALRAARAMLTCVMAGVPFLAWSLLTGQNPWATAREFVRFGGYGGEYALAGLKGMFVVVTEQGGPWYLLLPSLIAAVLFAALQFRARPSAVWDRALPAAGLVMAMVPLAARQYPHYLQLPSLWGVLAWALAAEAWAARRAACDAAGGGHGLARAAALLALAWWSPVIVSMTALGVLEAWRMPIAAQQQTAAAVRRTLEPSLAGDSAEPITNIGVVNAEWLFALADLIPPGGDYHFVDPLAPADRWKENPRAVVVGAGPISRETIAGWLSSRGEYTRSEISAPHSLQVFRRANPAP